MATNQEALRGLRRHTLLTAKDRKALMKQAGQDYLELWEKQVITKFFCPYSYWTWYAVEFNGEDTFFGYVRGHEDEWGYWSYQEIQESIKTIGGFQVPLIERDCSFQPISVRELTAKIEAGSHP